jgi:hypothetical protein
VILAVGVKVDVLDGVKVAVGVRVGVLVGVAVGLGVKFLSRQTGTESPWPPGSLV